MFAFSALATIVSHLIHYTLTFDTNAQPLHSMRFQPSCAGDISFSGGMVTPDGFLVLLFSAANTVSANMELCFVFLFLWVLLSLGYIDSVLSLRCSYSVYQGRFSMHNNICFSVSVK